MKSAKLGTPTSEAEVTNITPFGLWMLIGGEEKFLPFENFPWFRSATVNNICAVELPSENHLYWPQLDIDLAVESVDHPERFPLLSKIAQQDAAVDRPKRCRALGSLRRLRLLRRQLSLGVIQIEGIMAESRWYDKFAPLYNVGTLGDLFYRQARKKAIDELGLSSGSKVLDVFCGTGVDFEPLHREVGDHGRILAADGSPGMLKGAKSRSATLGIKENCIDFLEADLSQNSGIEKVVGYIRTKQPRHVLFSLGLTCLENWHDFTSEILTAVEPGTRLAIMDVYSKRLTLGARIINWIGAADCQRTVWKALEEHCESFQWFEFRPFKVLDVSVFVASGTKPVNV